MYSNGKQLPNREEKKNLKHSVVLYAFTVHKLAVVLSIPLNFLLSSSRVVLEISSERV